MITPWVMRHIMIYYSNNSIYKCSWNWKKLMFPLYINSKDRYWWLTYLTWYPSKQIIIKVLFQNLSYQSYFQLWVKRSFEKVFLFSLFARVFSFFEAKALLSSDYLMLSWTSTSTTYQYQVQVLVLWLYLYWYLYHYLVPHNWCYPV